MEMLLDSMLKNGRRVHEQKYVVVVVVRCVIEFIDVKFCCNCGNDHTNMTAPLPVCSAKLSMFGPG